MAEPPNWPLVQDYDPNTPLEYGDEYLAIDVVDSNMWLQLKTLALVQQVIL